MKLKDYISVVRKTSFLGAFITQYLMRIIIVYLLAKNVTPWVAVSIPIIIEFGRVLSRVIEPISKISLKVNYRSYSIFFIVSFAILSVLLSQCTTLYTIYPLTLVLGVIYGVWAACLNKLDTSNTEYQSHCLYEDEKFNMVGCVAGLLVSQFIYDINPTLYIISFIIVAIIGVIICLKMKNIEVTEDTMLSYEQTAELTKKEKKNLLSVTIMFGALIGVMNVVYNSIEAIPPLISDKAGYLSSIYCFVQFLVMCLISGVVIEKIRKKQKLLFGEALIAIIYAILLTIAGIFHSIECIILVFILYGVSSPLAEPLWGSIISEYSENNRRKFIYINKVYFFTRMICLFMTLLIVKSIVTTGISGFAILGICSVIGLIILYIIANKVNKKIYGHSI